MVSGPPASTQSVIWSMRMKPPNPDITLSAFFWGVSGFIAATVGNVVSLGGHVGLGKAIASVGAILVLITGIQLVRAYWHR